jgi:hypothetical protein
MQTTTPLSGIDRLTEQERIVPSAMGLPFEITVEAKSPDLTER